MKQLEDRIKDRLEAYESRLPEGDFAEFKALLDGTVSKGQKGSAAFLKMLVPLAVAAALLLLFVLGRNTQKALIQPVEDRAYVAELAETESVEDSFMLQAEPEDKKRTPRTTNTGNKKMEKTEKTVSPSSDSEALLCEHDIQIQETTTNEQNGEGEQNDSNLSMNGSPFVPSVGIDNNPVSVKLRLASAGILGGAGALALTSVVTSLMMNEDSFNAAVSDGVIGPGGGLFDPGACIDKRIGNDSQLMPIRAGLSIRIPVNDNWSFTTGLDYSLYFSRFSYSLSGIHKQSVQYLGIPFRADYTIAKNRWIDVYVGTGVSADFCVAADDTGYKINKDGAGFSLIGAGGFQFNISRNFGLFLEPSFSWDFTSERRILETYRMEHPLMFSVSTGLRFSLPARKL